MGGGRKNKNDTSNKSNWNHSKITQKYLSKETATMGTPHSADSADVKVQNIQYDNITCSTECKYRTGATLYTLETWFVSGTKVINNNKGGFSLHPTRLCTSHRVIICPATPCPLNSDTQQQPVIRANSVKAPFQAQHHSVQPSFGR
jgi:hypothetical protein